MANIDKYAGLEIPDFLRRKHQKCETTQTKVTIKPNLQGPQKIALTKAYKDRVASNIIAAIRQGNDTFGKIRKTLDYDDRSLKAGLRHAHNWLPIIERSGSVQRPQLTRKQARVENNGRRYSVVIV